MDYLLNKRILRHILLWTGILVLSCIQTAIGGGWQWIHTIIYLSFLPSYIITVYLVFYWLLPNFLLKNKFLIFLILFELINFLFINSRLLIRPYLYPLIDVKPSDSGYYELIIYYEFTSHIIVGSAVSLKLLMMTYQDKLLKFEMLKEKTVTELNLLKSQINPHFLLNALNNMDELIFENQEKASSYLFDLSNILQYVLYECNDDEIPLDREIEFVRKYIKLYSVNFKDGFVDFNVTGKTDKLLIPPMLFIPLIENAMKHSNKNIANPGIAIDIAINNKNISLKTKNHIKTTLIKKSINNGMGFENLKRRLVLLYAENQGLIKTENNGIFQTELYISV